jgi:hypothetical protein
MSAVFYRPCWAIDAGENEGIACSCEVGQHLRLNAPRRGADGPRRGAKDEDTLIHRGYALLTGVAQQRLGRPGRL